MSDQNFDILDRHCRNRLLFRAALVFIVVTLIAAYTLPLFSQEHTSEQQVVVETELLAEIEGDWSGDSRITNNISPSKDPSIAVDNEGIRHVVWVDNREGNSEIYYSRLGVDDSAIISEQKLTNSISPSIFPQIAIDSQGHVHVNWLELTMAKWDLYYMVLGTDGDVINEPVAIVNVMNVNEMFYGDSFDVVDSTLKQGGRLYLNSISKLANVKPTMGIDNNDVIHIFVPISRNNTFRMNHCRIENGEMVKTTLTSGSTGDVGRITTDFDGKYFYLCWEEQGDQTTLFYSKFSTYTNSLYKVYAISEISKEREFHTTIGRIGENILVAWSDSPISGTMESTYIHGKVISDTGVEYGLELTDTRSYPRELASISVPDGLYLVWMDERVGPSTTELVYAFYDSNIAPHEGRHLTSQVGESRSPAIAHHRGEPIVVWEDTRDGNIEIYINHKFEHVEEAIEDEEPIHILEPIKKDPSIAAGSGFGLLALVLYIAKHKELMLLVPAYSRLSNKEIVENPTRKMILEYLESNPGANFSHLMEALSIKNGVLSHHLRTLERSGHLRSKKDGSLRRYYPPHYTVPMSLEEKMLYALAQNPGISESGLAKEIGVTRQVVNYHMLKLLNKRKVAVRKEGKLTKCYALSLTPT